MMMNRSLFRLRVVRDESYVRRSFWSKLTRFAALIPFAEDVVAAYYAATDRATPNHVKVVLFGALAYFVMPIDAIPDILPTLGFADDAAVLAGALRLVTSHITPEHREKAKAVLAKLPGFVIRR
jgi:uncharacterized membrane protein YkvA (DUF1232 family)